MDTEQTLIKRLLGIDITDPVIRQRAWRRIRIFREIIAEYEAEHDPKGAVWLRRIIERATGPEPDLICLAMLAGPEITEDED